MHFTLKITRSERNTQSKPYFKRKHMKIEVIVQNYRNMVVDNIRLSLISLQSQLIKSSKKLEYIGPSTAVIKEMAVGLSDSIGPVERLLEQIKTGNTTKALILIDSEGKAIDLLSGEALTNQEALSQILENAKTPEK